MKKLIGLAGNAGAGKDYIHAKLDRTYPGTVERVAFADGLKFDIEETLGTLPFDLPALRAKPYKPEIRKLLQWWGTELRRSQDDEYWVKRGLRAVQESSADLVVITDIRFKNEAQAVKRDNGIVIEVYAHPEIRRARLGGSLPSEHASEVIDFLTDGTIINNQTPIFPTTFVEYLDGFLPAPGS